MIDEDEMNATLNDLGLASRADLKNLQDQIANELPERDRIKIVAAIQKRNRKNAKRLEIAQR